MALCNTFGAAELKLPIRLHGDQLNDLGCGKLAAQYSALSCDHCEYTSDESIAAMADKGVVAVLLPTANYFIGGAPPFVLACPYHETHACKLV
jgi:imidazolonepropionase-like amidohydrolase